MRRNNSALFQSGIFFLPLIIIWLSFGHAWHVSISLCATIASVDISRSWIWVNFNFSLRATNSLKDPRTISTTNVPSRSAKRVQHAGEITHAGQKRSSAESGVYEEDVIKIGPSKAVSIVRYESERTRIETRVFRKTPSHDDSFAKLFGSSYRVRARLFWMSYLICPGALLSSSPRKFKLGNSHRSSWRRYESSPCALRESRLIYILNSNLWYSICHFRIKFKNSSK